MYLLIFWSGLYINPVAIISHYLQANLSIVVKIVLKGNLCN